MLKHIVILLCFVSIQALVDATENESSDIDKVALEDAIKEINKEESAPDDAPDTKPEEKEDEVTQGQRRKRQFQYRVATGVSSFSSAVPNYSDFRKRDNAQNIGFYGTNNNEGTFQVIYQKVLELAKSTRQYLPPNPPQPVIPIPTFVPFPIYIPQIECGCETTAKTPASNRPTMPPTNQQTSTLSPIPTTGFVENPPSTNMPTFTNRVGEDDDGIRPISFVPIPPKRPLTRPVPPVEHGSVQAGAEPATDNFQNSRFPIADEAPSLSTTAEVDRPSVCEGAILRCCLQYQENQPPPQVLNQCLSSEGCSDPLAYDDPCSAEFLLRVIYKFRDYFSNKRNG